MFIVVHRLFSMPVSLPNRGADGLAKSAPYGGVMRSRISSQCIKAHLRKSAVITDLAVTTGLGMSVRSALIGERRIAPALVTAGVSADEAPLWASTVMALFKSGKPAKEEKAPKAKGKGKKAKAEDETIEAEIAEGEDETSSSAKAAEASKDAVLVLGEQEISALTAIAQTMHAAGIVPGDMRDLVQKPSKRRSAPADVQEGLAALDAIKRHAGLDGALFGRMATGVALSNVDAAVSVGHALSVHGVQSTVDFWSAQDALRDRDAGEAGGAHINTRELVSGVYYMPVVIDVQQVVRNTGLGEDHLRALVAALVETIATVSPAAMLGSTAAYADPGEVIIEVTRRQPINGMRAFERPANAVLEDAAKVLDAHLRRLWSLSGRPVMTVSLSSLIDDAQETSAVERLAQAIAMAAAPNPAEAPQPLAAE